MSGARKPVVGEVWTTREHDAWTCIVDVPDAKGCYVWDWNGYYRFFDLGGMTPPKPQPPTWLADRWVNVYRSRAVSGDVHGSATSADRHATPDRIGRVSLTGEWVPCDGKTVLV